MCGGGGGGGGDGGAAERKAKEDARIAAATNKINIVLGQENAKPLGVDKEAFTTRVSAIDNHGGRWTTRNNRKASTTFNQAGYEAAVAQAASDAASSQNAFAERLKLYDKAGTDAKTKAMIDLDKEHGVVERGTNFDIARSGLTGGSRDIDANREVLDTYQQGVLKAGTMADQVKNSMRSADDKTRVGLIDSIRTGLDQGSAVNQAYDSMRNNANQATAEANNVSLAGFFDRLNNANQVRKQLNGFNAAPAAIAGVPTTTRMGQPADSNGTIRP